MNKDNRRAAAILGGSVMMLGGAFLGEWLIYEPAMVAGFDLRVLIPDPMWVAFLVFGVFVSLCPREGSGEGRSAAQRATRYVLLVVFAVGVYYFLEIAGYAGKKGTVLQLARAYSTGYFRPKVGPWFFGHLFLIFTLVSPALLFIKPDLFAFSERKKKDVVVRGRSLLSYEQAAKKIKLSHDERTIFFGMLELPERLSTSHFLVTGTTGAGKTTVLRLLMQSVLPWVGKGNTRALVYDAKQDILSLLYGMGITSKVVTLNPFDERCAGWAMAKDVTSPAVAEQIATILVPSERNSSNPFFSQAARSLLSGVIVAFIRSCPGKWSFADVLNAFRSVETLKTILLGCSDTAYLVERYFSNERTANDVMATLDTKLRPYQTVAAAWSRAQQSISLSEWLSDEYILVLGNDEEARSPIDAINQVIFKRLSELVIAQPESTTRRTWFFIDELKEAGRLEGLTSLLTKGRSKGACVVLGFQDIEGLSVTYGDSRAAKEIVGLCANKAILRTDSTETAKWAASLFGSREMLEYRTTESSGESKAGKQTSTTQSEQIQQRETVLYAEIGALPVCGPANGLSGYYIIPEIGAYKAAIGWRWIQDILLPPDLSVPNVVRRPSEHQYLSGWGTKDQQRLGISIDTSAGHGLQAQTSESKTILDIIHR